MSGGTRPVADVQGLGERLLGSLAACVVDKLAPRFQARAANRRGHRALGGAAVVRGTVAGEWDLVDHGVSVHGTSQGGPLWSPPS